MEQTYTISNIAAYDLKNTEIIGSQDPYVVFEIGRERVQTKQCKKGGTSPVWHDTVHLRVPSGTSIVKVMVYNDNSLRPDSLIGSTELSTPLRGGRVGLVDKKGKPSGELTFDASSSGNDGQDLHRTGQIGTGIGAGGAAVGAGSGMGGHHTPGSGVGGHHTPDSAVGGGYQTTERTGQDHHHHGPGTVGHGSAAPGSGYGREGELGNRREGGGIDAGDRHQASGYGQGGYHHEERKSHKDESESFTETYGPGGEPTMSQRAKHAADEGMESVKDHIPGKHGNRNTAPGSGYDNTRY